MEVKQKAALIYNAIEDKKGSRISVLDICYGRLFCDCRC